MEEIQSRSCINNTMREDELSTSWNYKELLILRSAAHVQILRFGLAVGHFNKTELQKKNDFSPPPTKRWSVRAETK